MPEPSPVEREPEESNSSELERTGAHKASDLEFTRLATSRGWLSEESGICALLEADRSAALGMEKTVDEILLESGDSTAPR